MKNNFHIPVVLGTSRVGRQSEKVAKYTLSIIKDNKDISTELVDVKDHLTGAATTPPWGKGGADEAGSNWKNIVANSNALILIIPEYNHGYPGELKLLLDSLGQHYKGLPVLLIGVSSGKLGGARVIEHIKPVLIELYLTPIRESVTIPEVRDAFNDDGSIKNKLTTERINNLLRELVQTAKTINIK